MNFIINDKQEKLVKEFKQKHKECLKKKLGIAYCFTPCSIGNSVSIKCNGCGETKNITDYDNW